MAKTLQFYDRNGATVITGKTLADILSGTADTAVKIGIKNTGDALVSTLKCSILQLGSNDGFGQLRIGRDLATLSVPWGVNVVVGSSGAGGGWGGIGTVYYVVTALNATGETIQSDDVQAIITSTTQAPTITSARVTGATKYRLYRSVTIGSYGASSLIAESVGVAAPTFIDLGASPSTGAPPSANTTGGASPNYGSSPALAATPVTIGALASGQWVYVWIARVVPVSVDDAMNPRLAGLLFAE